MKENRENARHTGDALDAFREHDEQMKRFRLSHGALNAVTEPGEVLIDLPAVSPALYWLN